MRCSSAAAAAAAAALQRLLQQLEALGGPPDLLNAPLAVAAEKVLNGGPLFVGNSDADVGLRRLERMLESGGPPGAPALRMGTEVHKVSKRNKLTFELSLDEVGVQVGFGAGCTYT